MSQSQSPSSVQAAEYGKLLHNTAIFALVACPLLALVPPRKLDFYTFGLVGLTGFSANYLTRERTGRPITAHLGLTAEPRAPPPPPTAQQWSSTASSAQQGRNPGGVPLGMKESRATGPVSEEIQTQRAAWKVQREKEIREDVEEGKGFGDMIVDQIWEVWNWGRPKKDDDE